MALASFMAQAAGAVSSAAGAYSTASGQRSALMASAAAAELNAKQADSNSLAADKRGEYETTALGLRGADVKARQRAGYASGNIDLTQGSPQAAIAGTDVITQIDVNTARSNAIREAYGFRTEATQHRGEAAVGRATGKAISPTLAATTSLLGSAAPLADKWYTGKNTGAFDAGKARLSSLFKPKARPMQGPLA